MARQLALSNTRRFYQKKRKTHSTLSDRLVRPTANRVFLPETMNQVHRLITQLDQPNGFTVQSFRDSAGIGRNLAIELLEYLDRKGVTRRDGNVRFLRL